MSSPIVGAKISILWNTTRKKDNKCEALVSVIQRSEESTFFMYTREEILRYALNDR